MLRNYILYSHWHFYLLILSFLWLLMVNGLAGCDRQNRDACVLIQHLWEDTRV